MAIPRIITPRLALRPFNLLDTPDLFAILQTPDILKYFPPLKEPLTRERAERIIIHQLKQWEEHGYGWWAVESRETSRLLGWNGLQYLPQTGETEVGYLLSQESWGHGLATEGAIAALEYGFEVHALDEIIGLAHPENKRSQRVLLKLGMHATGLAEYFDMPTDRFVLKGEIWRQGK